MLFQMETLHGPSETLIRPTAAVNGAFVDGKGRVLLTRRSDKVRSPGFWCLPGGHVEVGERWWEAMAREAAEEVGLEALEGKLIGVYADPALTMTQATGERWQKQFVAAVFRIELYRGEVSPNDEVDAADWFLPDVLPSPMLPSHPPRVKDVFARREEVFVR